MLIWLYLFLAFAAGFVFAVWCSRDAHTVMAQEIGKLKRDKADLQKTLNETKRQLAETNRMLYGELAGDESDWWKGDGKN